MRTFYGGFRFLPGDLPPLEPTPLGPLAGPFFLEGIKGKETLKECTHGL